MGDDEVSEGSGRLSLGATRWWVWEHFALRSAGFPMRDLTEQLAVDADDDGPRECLRRALELACDDRFTMALLWHNPSIVDNVVAPLRRWQSDDDGDAAMDTKRARQRLRRRERTLASYLQRYYTKNDTIGFFGPIAWGRFADQESPVVVTAHESVTDQQLVSMEDWAVHRLASEIARDPVIRWHLRPALCVGVVWFGRTVICPGAAPQRLTGPEAAVLSLVDGQRSAAAIAELLDDHDVAGILDSLCERGIVSWGFEVPVDLQTEQDLLHQLDELPDLPAVHDARAVVMDLIAARDLAAGATNPSELAAALRKADECYAARTGEAPRRTADAAERGRGLFVAQSRRAVDVTVSKAMLAELAKPLDLILASARWFCGQIGQLAEQRLREAYHELSSIYGPAGVPVALLFGGVMLDFVRDEAAFAPIHDELVRRWTAVLRLDAEARVATFTADELSGAVAENFASVSPSWYAGRHHSPDIMIAASDVSAIERGDYLFVLGEVHVGAVTCDSGTLNRFPPGPDAILAPAGAALDGGPQRYVPLYYRGMGVTCRYYPSPETFSDRYYYLSFGARDSERRTPAGRRIDLASVTVVEEPDCLHVEFPDGTRQPILVVAGELLSLLTTSAFSIMPAWAHTPRVVVDRLVIARETWRIPATELVLPGGRAGAHAVGHIRDVARRHGLARHCFWRVKPGQKPIYLDLNSPMLVRLLADSVRKAVDESTTVCFTEMLPGPDQLWLADARDRRYTSELRITVAERRPDA
jgi:hypothetical protein